VEDIDAAGGGFVHWLVFDIPQDTRNIASGSVPGTQALNSSGQTDYYGPCPPSGTHRYVFTVYALDAKLGLDEGTPARPVRDAIARHVIDQGSLTGLYRRR
jgi:Raf kinase inhibitor-like YbhB/YbcL family protein